MLNYLMCIDKFLSNARVVGCEVSHNVVNTALVDLSHSGIVNLYVYAAAKALLNAL